MSRIYVSGCAGFIGSNIFNYLTEAGFDVDGCDNLQFGYRENVLSDNWQALDFDELVGKICNYDILIHCATSNIIYAQENPIETHKNNTIKTINLFEQFRGKIIYLSTSSVYGDADVLPTPEAAPKNLTNAYARSKYCAELFLRDRGNYTTLRLTNVYGINQRPDHPYSGVIGKVLDAMLNTGEIKIYGDGKQTRDFVYVGDVVDAVIRAIELPVQNTEINIGTGIETSVNDLIKISEEIVGSNYLAYNTEPRSIDNINRRCLDNWLARELLGWSPKTTMREGLKITAAWLASIR